MKQLEMLHSLGKLPRLYPSTLITYQSTMA